MLFVFSNRVFLKYEDWGFFSSKLFQIRAWHKASLPIPFCCPPTVLIFFNDNYDVSFTDVQLIHVLKGDQNGNVVISLRAQEGPNMCLLIWVWVFYPAFRQKSASALLVGKEPEILGSEGIKHLLRWLFPYSPQIFPASLGAA